MDLHSVSEWGSLLLLFFIVLLAGMPWADCSSNGRTIVQTDGWWLYYVAGHYAIIAGYFYLGLCQCNDECLSGHCIAGQMNE